MAMDFRNRSVNQSHFAMVPRADIPRSTFTTEFTHKTTFNSGYLIPVYLEEVLPGDTFRVSMTAFARMATPVFPVMDNFHLDSFFFFVPNRLLWTNWTRMMGERLTPDASIDFTTPQVTVDAAIPVCSLLDYLGVPTDGQTTTYPFTINALPARAYRLIYQEWFRDQNIDIGVPGITGAGPDPLATANVLRSRRKRHDYFTSCLPWPQKGDAVSLPMAGQAPIVGLGVRTTGTNTAGQAWETSGGQKSYTFRQQFGSSQVPATGDIVVQMSAATDAVPQIFADLSQATAATINALRQAFQIQRLLERDARGGTRYTELLLAHFGVQPQDARLQRPEYLGGDSTPVSVNPIAQTSATGISGGASPLGALGGVGTAVPRHGFSYSAMEHGFIMGIVSIRADLTYQQGLHRLWSRNTRYDYYWPAFAHLGEQAVLRKEIYLTGDSGSDNTVFGYQERWAEYRYHPSMITGLFRSTAAGNIDEWHAAQHFTTAPLLNTAFMVENPPMERILAAGALAASQQWLFDSVFSVRVTRAMPTYSVPGFIDRF